MANKYDYLMSIDTDFKLKDIGSTKILNDLKEVELVLLNITKDYGFSKTARSLALDLMDYNVDEKTIRDFNKKYGSKSTDEVMIYISREYDKGFSDFMDVYSKKSMKESSELGDELDDFYFDGYPTFIENDVIAVYDDDKYIGFVKEFYTNGKIMSVIADFEDFYVFAVLDYRKKPIVAKAYNSYNEAKKKFIESQK